MRRISIVLAGVAMIGVACGHGQAPRPPPDPGPLAYVGQRTLDGLPAAPGQAVTFADSFIGRTGQPLTFTLLGVTLASPTAGLRVIGAGVVDAEGDPIPVNGELYPPKSGLAPLPFTSRALLRIVLGIVADVPGTYRAPGLLVRYVVDGQTYQAFYPNGVRMCVGRSSCQEAR